MVKMLEIVAFLTDFVTCGTRFLNLLVLRKSISYKVVHYKKIVYSPSYSDNNCVQLPDIDEPAGQITDNEICFRVLLLLYSFD